MKVSEFKKYISSLETERDNFFDKNDKKRAGKLNINIKFLKTATGSLKDDDDIDLDQLKQLLVVKKTNCNILAEEYLNLGNEDLMDDELEQVTTMEEVEEYLDKLLA